MSWSRVQQKRLLKERQILSQYFKAFEWINPTDSCNTCIEGDLLTNSKNKYQIRVYIPGDYPNSRPDMVVVSPDPLIGFNGKNLLDFGADMKMHTLSPRNGHVNICHYRDWLPNLTLYLVVLKGRIWLEALDAYRNSGLEISEYLPHM